MKILVDTNVIIDILCKREPFFEDSYNSLNKCIDNHTIIELTHSGECGLFFIKLSSSPDLYSIIVLSLLFEGMCCYE